MDSSAPAALPSQCGLETFHEVPAAQPDSADMSCFTEMSAFLAYKGKEAEAQPDEVPLLGSEELVKLLQQCMDTGKLDPRSSVGQRFVAHMAKSSDKDEYNSIKGSGSTKAKLDFRLKWAAMMLKGHTTKVSKKKIEEVEEEHKATGRYMAFDKLCVEEGGLENPAAVKRASSYAMECVRRGPPYLRYNSWKCCTELMYFEEIYNNIHRSKNNITREDYQEVTHVTTAPPEGSEQQVQGKRGAEAALEPNTPQGMHHKQHGRQEHSCQEASQGEDRGSP